MVGNKLKSSNFS